MSGRTVLVPAEAVERVLAVEDCCDEQGRNFCAACGKIGAGHLADCPIPELQAALTTPTVPGRETLAELLAQAQAGNIGVKLLQYPGDPDPSAQALVWRQGERGELGDGATVEDSLRAALARLSASAPAAGGKK